jgi:hypothetical protein
MTTFIAAHIHIKFDIYRYYAIYEYTYWVQIHFIKVVRILNFPHHLPHLQLRHWILMILVILHLSLGKSSDFNGTWWMLLNPSHALPGVCLNGLSFLSSLYKRAWSASVNALECKPLFGLNRNLCIFHLSHQPI